MKFKIVKCLTPHQTELREIWVYTSKTWSESYTKFGEPSEVEDHRVACFMPLHLHLILEQFVEELGNRFLLPFSCKKLWLLYDIVHGIISSYGIKDILKFWRPRSKDNMTEL